MASVNEFMWNAQNILHKKPQVVPGILLALSSSLVVYRHVTHSEPEGESDPIKTFLALILVQMLPLVALEMKIMQCADPVGLFCKFATPVTLTHAFFLGMRLVNYHLYESMTVFFSTAAFLGSLAALRVGYRQSLLGMVTCSSVWGLVGLAFMAAVVTTAVDDYLNPKPYGWDWQAFYHIVFQTSNSYTEVVAFVPAVWIVFREANSGGRCQVESTDTKRTATAFFAFLVGFYLTEDLLSAVDAYSYSQMASLAHVAHFLLLVDFGCYVLAHIYNPEKLMGELRRWLPVDVYHEV